MLTQKSILAIDPGFSGGIVFSDNAGNVSCVKMPERLEDLLGLLRSFSGPDVIAIENVGGYRPGNSGPAAVKFARHVGNLEALLLALYPFSDIVFIAPQTWLKSFPGCPKGETLKTARKNFVKDAVTKIFPGVRVFLWNSDALGILFHILSTK